MSTVRSVVVFVVGEASFLSLAIWAGGSVRDLERAALERPLSPAERGFLIQSRGCRVVGLFGAALCPFAIAIGAFS
jgi:hypothetical protein